MNVYMQTYILHIHIYIFVMNLKETKEECIREFRRSKSKWELCDYIIISKNTRNNFKN